MLKNWNKYNKQLMSWMMTFTMKFMSIYLKPKYILKETKKIVLMVVTPTLEITFHKTYRFIPSISQICQNEKNKEKISETDINYPLINFL